MAFAFLVMFLVTHVSAAFEPG